MQLSDAVVEVLAQLKTLEELRGVSGAAVCDLSLAQLAGLPTLRVLAVPGIVPGPSIAAALKGGRLREATFLQLNGAALQALVDALPQLEVLLLPDSRLTDEGLKPLAFLKNLRELSLSNCTIRGPGLTALATIRSLERLDLAGATCDQVSLGHPEPATALARENPRWR